jgi:hypothetical protein
LFAADPVMFIMQNCIRNFDYEDGTYQPQLVATSRLCCVNTVCPSDFLGVSPVRR